REAVKKLAELHDAASVVPLASMLQPTEGSESLVPDVRAALQQIGARAVLVEKLSSASKDDKVTAISFLGLLKDPAALEPLAAQLGDADTKVRENAASALGKLNDRRAVPALTKALADKEADVRMASAQ